jgi:cell wall-associated NlpC family hydrolase
VKLNFSIPTTPESLLLDPDSVFYTKGVADTLDRVWVIESITHTWTGGSLVTSGTAYSPMKNKFPSSSSGSSSGDTPVDLPPGCRGKVAQAAIDYKGSDTSAGPDNGRNACVYAVNRVFESVGLTPPWGNSEYVPTVESGLISSGAQLVSSGDEQPGDIAIANGEAHVGVVIGSNQVISNSSSAAKFVWNSDTDFDGYYSGSSKIYRLNC